MMLESRSGRGVHIPVSSRTTLSTGSMTAADLTEMRLLNELWDVQERMMG